MAIYGNMVVPSRARAAGALPTDNSDRKVYQPGSEVSARYSDAGGVLAAQAQGREAEGLQGLAKGIGSLSPMFVNIHERNQRLDLANAQAAFSQLQNEYIEKQREWSQIKGANAVNMEELKSRWWDEAMPRLTKGLGEYGTRYFNLHADRVGAMADTFIQNHQEREIGQYEGQQLKLAMDSEGNMIAANPFDPAAAAASQGRIRGLIHQEAVRKGWTPEMEEQAFLAASGKAWGNAIAVRISMGDFDGAQALMQQYGASVSPEDQARLRQAWSSGKMGLIASKAAAGDIDGVRRELGAGQGLGGSFDATIAARAAQYNGRKYGGVGGFDCSAYVRLIGKDQVPAQYQDIFAGSSEHMLDRAGELTGHLYRGGEVNAGTITSGGWLIGIAEPNAKHVRATKAERPNDIGHVAMTFMQNGVVMVTENASGRGVNSVPLAEYLDRYKGRMLFAANLNALPQGGGLPGGYKGVPSGGTVNVLPQYKPMLEQAAQQAGVDPVLIQAIAMQESDGGRDLRTSPKDAVGIMQVRQDAADEVGGGNRYDMKDNARLGAKYFALMLEQAGGPGHEFDALRMYNMGPTAFRKWKAAGGDESKLSQEAREYPYKVLGHIKGGSVGAQPQQQAPAQAVPAGVDQSKWDTLYQNTRGDAELAAVGYKLGYAKAMEWADAGRKIEALPKDVQAFLQEVKANGGKPKAGAVVQAPAPAQGAQQTPAQGFQLTPSEQQKAMNEFVPQAAANAIVDTARSKGGSMAQIKADAFAQLEALPAGERDKYRPIVERRLADLEQNQLAEDGVLYEQTIKTLAGMSPRDREAFIAQMSASGKASPELVKKVRTWNSGVKAVEKESGEAWASEMRGRMDNYYADAKAHSDALEKEVRVKQMRGEITDETAQKLMEWSRTGGSRKNFTQETLKKLYNEGVPKAEWKDPPEDLVQRLWAQMRNAGDKPVGEDEIREMMRKEMLPTTTPYPGMMPFKKTEEVPYHQAMSEGRKVLGVKMDTEQIPQLKREMEEQARRRPDFKLNPNNPEDVKAYYAGKLGGKW